MSSDILLVDKPAGWTSFDVVAKIRGALRASYSAKGEKPTKKQLKVGHVGTLDPFATGLLVILLGEGCSRADELLKLDKTYEAVFVLGKTSTTGDPEGEITNTGERRPEVGEILQVLGQFVGEITQVPPAYSAIKIDGERAYKLARAGKSVEMPPRHVTIYSLDLLSYNYPELSVRVEVSSGTYIRTLAEDIGKALGTGAYCGQLRRTVVGQFYLENALLIGDALNSQLVS